MDTQMKKTEMGHDFSFAILSEFLYVLIRANKHIRKQIPKTQCRYNKLQTRELC